MFQSIKWLQPTLLALSQIKSDSWFYSDKIQRYYNRFSKRKLVHANSFFHIFSKELTLNAPMDSVIHLRPEKSGVIVVSKAEGKVLKLFTKPEAIKQLDREIEVLKKVKDSAFAKFTNHYLDSGTTENGSRWVFVEYLDVTKQLDVETLFRDSFKIMNEMKEFYLVCGYKKINVTTWLSAIEEDIRRHPRKNDLMKVKDWILKEQSIHGDIELIQGHLHGDLQKDNVVVTPDGYKIIDWEGTCEGLILVDYFDFLRRFLNKNDPSPFWSFLRGKESLSNEFLVFIEELIFWHKEHFSNSLKVENISMLFMIYALERTVQLGRSERDDIPDKHTFEFQKVLEAIK